MRIALGIALFSGLVGCSTSYMPRSSDRVAVIQVGGVPSYVRDGRIYKGGIGGGELEEAVHGNPEAEQHARDYKSGTVSGLVTVLVGGVSMCVGAGVLAGDSAAAHHDKGRQISGAALAVGGLAAYIVGLVFVADAQPHMWDAINVYNDGVPPPRMRVQPPATMPAPPAPLAPVAPSAPVAPPASTDGPAAPAPPGS